MSNGSFEGERGFYDETLGVLVAGVTIPENLLTIARVEAIVAYATERRTEEETWAAVPGGDLSDLGDEEPADGPANYEFTVGLVIAQASSDECARVEVPLERMRAALERARRATAFFEGLRRLFEDDEAALTEIDWNVEVWLTSCGPLPAATLYFGVPEPREEGESEEEEAAAGELRWGCPVSCEQEWQYDEGVRGLLVAFAQFSGPETARIDLSSDAHAARLDKTAPLEGESSYYLLSRYD